MWILLAVLLVLVGFAVVLYNRLAGLRVRAQNAWSDIDVQLKRRHDLVPNLVETVRGYATHEQSTLQNVTEARARAVAAEGADPATRAEAEAGLSRALGGLSVAVEAYPELHAAGNFRELQGSLGAIEEAISQARRYYNAVVRDLNTAIVQFPSNLVAGAFGFGPTPFFLAEDDARTTPQVRF